MIKDLLTVRELQALLHVDRTTIYRMIRENRLPSFKVGGQWRFASGEVETWLAEHQPRQNETSPAQSPATANHVLPLHCVVSIQNVFAEALEVGTVTTNQDGEPLTELASPCEFCRLIAASPEGRRRCISSWQSLGRRRAKGIALTRCHAGLRYARGQVSVGGDCVAWVFAGQFLLTSDPFDSGLARALAAECGIDQADLLAASTRIRRAGLAEADKVLRLLNVVATTFSNMGEERASLVARLKRISEMSAL